MKGNLNKNVHHLLHLRRDRRNGGAPHKPILLLAISNLVERSEISSNCIPITPELVMEFKSLWSKLVVSNHHANFALPFFHMRSEPFWKLVSKNGMELPITSSHSIRSLRGLRESLAHAEISLELFGSLNNPIHREVIKQELLQAYFPETQENLKDSYSQIWTEISNQILNDSKEIYRKRLSELKESLKPEEFDEEMFVIGGVFQREVPKIYNYQCAVSGMRIVSTTNAQMIDACHIEPFSLNGDDTITNGISLCPNIHRAFDRGLLTLNDHYEVMISTKIVELESPFSLSQFDGKRIYLPKSELSFPSLENVKYHRNEIFVA